MQPSTQAQPGDSRLAYTVAALATEVGVSRQTIYREVEEGRLRAKRVRGRLIIPTSAVVEWLKPDLHGDAA